MLFVRHKCVQRLPARTFQHDLNRISLFQLAGNMYAHINAQGRRGKVAICRCFAISLQIHFYNLLRLEMGGIAYSTRELHLAVSSNESSKRDERTEVFQHVLRDWNYRAEQLFKVRIDHGLRLLFQLNTCPTGATLILGRGRKTRDMRMAFE